MAIEPQSFPNIRLTRKHLTQRQRRGPMPAQCNRPGMTATQNIPVLPGRPNPQPKHLTDANEEIQFLRFLFKSFRGVVVKFSQGQNVASLLPVCSYFCCYFSEIILFLMSRRAQAARREPRLNVPMSGRGDVRRNQIYAASAEDPFCYQLR